jgi:signal transduction histidine kinase
MRLASYVRSHAFDALVVALAAVAQVEIWTTSVPGPKAAVIPASLLWTLPLLLRRRFPFAAPAFAFAVQAASVVADPEAVGSEYTGLAALYLTFWVVGAHNERSQAIAGAALGSGSIAVIVQRDVRFGLQDWIVGTVIGSSLCLLAYVLQRRAQRVRALEEQTARVAREREERVRAAVADERARIARDLHDVIAHSVSVMTVQAGGARLLLEQQPERAREAALSVEETGRQALIEVRRLLGLLGKDDRGLAPRLGLAALDALVEQIATAGLPVEVTIEGTPRMLAPGVDVTAYRIVQEALTNALKHAGPARAQVTVRYGDDQLYVDVANDGGQTRNGADGSGHGLVGMRERVALYGGELECGPRAAGGYQVRARLPAEVAQP